MLSFFRGEKGGVRESIKGIVTPVLLTAVLVAVGYFLWMFFHEKETAEEKALSPAQEEEQQKEEQEEPTEKPIPSPTPREVAPSPGEPPPEAKVTLKSSGQFTNLDSAIQTIIDGVLKQIPVAASVSKEITSNQISLDFVEGVGPANGSFSGKGKIHYSYKVFLKEVSDTANVVVSGTMSGQNKNGKMSGTADITIDCDMTGTDKATADWDAVRSGNKVSGVIYIKNQMPEFEDFLFETIIR